jgi:hypothetical protein
MLGRLFRGRQPKQTDNLLDPGCGSGAFIAGVIRWCRKHGAPLPEMVGIESEPKRASQARIMFDSPGHIQIRCADFLTGPVERFDFIIGNPPYVAIYGFSADEKDRYRALYATARGRFDLYLLFFERALKSLNPGGRMVFITPEKFMYVETAAPLRRLLSAVEVEEIELVNEESFSGLVTYPTITTVINQAPARATTVRFRDGSHQLCVLDRDASWMPIIRGVRDQQSHGTTLKDICVRVSCGVATGADDVFVREAASLEPKLKIFVRPTIAGRELTEPGELGHRSFAMLIPYDEQGSLLAERELGALLPYLIGNRERLKERTCVRRKPWYAFHETPPLPDILRPKILCKDITEKPHFWIDRQGSLVPRHSVYYIVPTDAASIEQLCAYLNSSEASLWLAEHCQRAANGFLRLQSNILKMMPVPDGLALSHHRKPLSSQRPLSPSLGDSEGIVTR